MRTITGTDAIRYAEKYRVPLNKYADPVEPTARRVTVAEALEIVTEDPSLIYVSVAR